MALSDADGIVLDANPAYYHLYGYKPEAVLGQSFAVIFPPEGRAWAEAQYRETFTRAEIAPAVESSIRSNDGTERWVEVRYTFLTDPHGQRTVMLSVIRDITKRRRLERQQQELVAMITHDLRNPLTTIMGHAQLLQRRGTYSAQGVESILEHARHQARLINDLLDAANLEVGQLVLAREEVALTGLVERAVTDATLSAPMHVITLTAPDGLMVVWGDPVRLRQVLDNLLGNAVKYSPAGSTVQVGVERTDDGVRVMVADEGSGIDPATLPHLFERFYRTEAARQSGATGIGLGLAICKGLVEAHGGQIGVESTPGQGSRFWFTIPCTGSYD